MFDIGWTELVVIGVVALIVIGPKDLPQMFRQLGRFTAKARGMAREFQTAMEQAADETGLRDVASDLRKVANPRATAMEAVKDAAAKFEAWDPLKKDAAKAAAPAAAAGTAAPVTDAAANPALANAGPATQALAEEVARKRADRLAAISADAAELEAEPDVPAPAAAKGTEA